jgi:hypothetical protein
MGDEGVGRGHEGMMWMRDERFLYTRVVFFFFG